MQSLLFELLTNLHSFAHNPVILAVMIWISFQLVHAAVQGLFLSVTQAKPLSMIRGFQKVAPAGEDAVTRRGAQSGRLAHTLITGEPPAPPSPKATYSSLTRLNNNESYLSDTAWYTHRGHNYSLLKRPAA